MQDKNSARICVRPAPGKGRGVFAVETFLSGELIESAPVLVFDDGEQALSIDRTPLGSYYFRWKDDENAVLFGYGSLYNHSYEPNAKYVRNYAQETMDFVALREIAPGEEITINYNGRPDCREPLWFPCAG